MQKRILYQRPDGRAVIICPTPDSGLTLEQIAAKDVPFGTPYKVIDESDVPTDRTFRNAWEADIQEPDGFGADYGIGSTNEVIGWGGDGSPILRPTE